MDFPVFPEFFDASWAPLVMVIGFIVLVVFSVTINFVANSAKAEKIGTALFIGLGMGGFAFLIGMGALIFSMTSTVSAVAEWKSNAIAEVEETYGFELTSGEFSALHFPKSEPEDDFVAYGSIARTEKSGDSFEKRELTLIWSDGELFLAESVDGEEFVPLGTR